MKKRVPVVLLVHGGAGPSAPGKTRLQILAAALRAGMDHLKAGARSLDAVELAIRLLEDSGAFNAGHGSKLQLDGHCRMDASIMEGSNLKAGAVASIEDVKNPICAARLVMEHTGHVLLAGPGAGKLARHFGIPKGPPPTPAAYRTLRKAHSGRDRTARLYESIYPHGTVGAVARDRYGTLAAGASTGGVMRMLPGRVGDTPLIGSGTYADNEAGAVSMTGWGEGIARAVVAKEICGGLKRGLSAGRSTQLALKRLLARIRGQAGAIVINRAGRFAIVHTTPYMAAGHCTETEPPMVQARWFHAKR